MNMPERRPEPSAPSGQNASSSPRVDASPPTRSRGSGRLLAVFFAVLFGTGLLSGCAFYSFSGANIPSHLETIAIPIAQDNTSNPVPRLGANLTDLLTDRFVDRTSLSLTTNDAAADVVLTARIQRYRNQPTGVSGDERATTNEVTIEVQVRYLDQKEGEELLNRTFSGVASYNPVEAGITGEQQAARNALQNVSDDIFSTATSNW